MGFAHSRAPVCPGGIKWSMSLPRTGGPARRRVALPAVSRLLLAVVLGMLATASSAAQELWPLREPLPHVDPMPPALRWAMLPLEQSNAAPPSPKPSQSAVSASRYDPLRALKDDDVGKFYTNTGNYLGALWRYQDALVYMPEDQDAAWGAGNAAMHLKRYPEARRYFSLYLDLVPSGHHRKDAEKNLDKIEKIEARSARESKTKPSGVGRAGAVASPSAAVPTVAATSGAAAARPSGAAPGAGAAKPAGNAGAPTSNPPRGTERERAGA
jgi:hypothetical protein